MSKYSDPPMLTTFVRAFCDLLQQCADDDRLWKLTQAGIARHGLLNETILREGSNVPVVETERLDDWRYRHRLARQLRRPQGRNYWSVTIPLDRSRLKDNEYLVHMASILGYKWMLKLDPERSRIETRLTLLKTDAALLAGCLNRLSRHQSTAESVGAYIMHTFAQEEIDRVLGEQIEHAFDDVVRQIEERLDAAFDAIAADTRSQFEELTRRIHDRCDAALR